MSNDLILKGLKSTMPSRPGWVLIHSSLIHLQINVDLFKWEFLSFIKKYVEQGYTFVFPSFTFSFCSKGYFDANKSRSETGILADWVFELYDSIKTSHPIYSHVVIGKEADQALSASTISCFGFNSIFTLFESKNATVCMFGCDWDYCTPFHYFEELNNVPYRHSKDFYSKNDNKIKATMFVRDLICDAQNDFSPATQTLRKIGQIKISSISVIQSTTFKALSNVCNEQLSKNIYCYITNENTVKMKLSNLELLTNNDSLKVAVLANSNFEPLLPIFNSRFKELCKLRKLELYLNSYDQMYSDFYNGAVDRFNPDYCFLPSRLEDLYKVSELEFANLETFQPIDDYIQLIINLNSQVSSKIFVHLFPLMNNSVKGEILVGSKTNHYHFIQSANLKLVEATKTLKQVRLVSPEMLVPSMLNFDARQWYLGRIPYSLDTFEAFAKKYCGYLLHETGNSIRLIILDLDNTLWGGVIGEDGINGILLGGDFPGNVFKDFQKTIIGLKERGIALAIVSKNDENVALECISKHPDMLIKLNDLAAYKINWQEKYINIQEIVEQVGLGLDNIMFIDDNPVEREKVKVNLPEVKVLELPEDPVLYRQALLESPFISFVDITPEDKNRADNYVTSRTFNEQKVHCGSIDNFLLSLNIELEVNALDEFNFSRALQLINKTNQFNTTTLRHNEASLTKLQKSKNYFIRVISYKDNVTELEKIGVFIVRFEQNIAHIESFLLSCRVLGRNLEQAIMAWLTSFSFQQGFDYISAEIVETPRNTPVRDIYQRLGFELQSANKWRLKSSNNIITPSYIKVIGD